MKLFVLIISSLIISFCHGQEAEGNRGYIVQIGDKAPDFTMELISGETIQLSDLQGKVVMLQFTASWCGVCRKEMPHIENDIWLKLKEREDFALLGIDRDEPKDKVLRFIEKTGITYPIGLDPRAEIFQLYALKEAGVTRNVIINREGVIIMLTRLFNEEEFEKMKTVIFSELKE
jgi:peroxiredoxin